MSMELPPEIPRQLPKPDYYQQLSLEYAIQEAIIDGRLTVEEGTQCLNDFIGTFTPEQAT